MLHIDAFTDKPFSGNPAAVCLLPPPSSDAWKQLLAAEVNLSETAFVEQLREDAQVFAGGRVGIVTPHHYGLRWFTPAAEVPLCGHATLASAHALWEEGLVPRDAEITFTTRSGALRATLGDGGITLDFPAIVAEERPVPDGLESALGARIVHFAESATKLLVELETEEDVRSLKPNLAMLASLPKEGVIVTARSSGQANEAERCDFVSRFFAPRLGVPEDPVTGSSHSVLGPWWQAKLGKSEFHARQLSARGGAMQVRVATFAAETRVFLTGKAVTVARGELRALAGA
jgi:PhzF family phenazine biosynthesis protein